jgi:hypothetical protein
MKQLAAQEQTANKTNSMYLSPQENYKGQTTAAGRRLQYQILRIEGCPVVSATDPHSR